MLIDRYSRKLKEMRLFNMIEAPCKNCNDRYLGCHSDCAPYKQYRADHDLMTATMRRERDSKRGASIDAIVLNHRAKLGKSTLK